MGELTFDARPGKMGLIRVGALNMSFLVCQSSRLPDN